MVQNSSMSQGLMIDFSMCLGVSERASELACELMTMSAAEHASETSSAEKGNDRAVRANKRMDQ